MGMALQFWMQIRVGSIYTSQISTPVIFLRILSFAKVARFLNNGIENILCAWDVWKCHLVPRSAVTGGLS